MGSSYMENKDKQVLKKIYTHIDSVLKYCSDCSSLEEFKENGMRVCLISCK